MEIARTINSGSSSILMEMLEMRPEPLQRSLPLHKCAEMSFPVTSLLRGSSVYGIQLLITNSVKNIIIINSVALVRERTTPAKRPPPLVGEVSVNLSG
jgi:hypothetical protein